MAAAVLLALLIAAGAALTIGQAPAPAPTQAAPPEPSIASPQDAPPPPSLAASAPAPDGAPLEALNDAALHRLAAAQGWPGSGRADDPIRIVGLVGHVDTGTALHLRDTTLHVEVRGAMVSTKAGDAVVLDNATHVVLQDLVAHGERSALRISRGSVTVTGGALQGDYAGLEAADVQALAVRGVDLQGGQYGARIGGHGATVEGVVASAVFGTAESAGAGILLEGRGHVVRGSLLATDAYAGVWVIADDVEVVGNTFRPERHAVVVQDSQAVDIVGNQIDGGLASVLTRSTAEVRIRHNSFASPDGPAVESDHDRALFISDNRFDGAPRAVAAFVVHAAHIERNTITGGTQAIDLVDCRAAVVAENDITASTMSGISLFASAQANIVDNTMTAMPGFGVFIAQDTVEAQVEHNDFATVAYALFVGDGAEGAQVAHNQITGPGARGIMVERAAGTHLDDNTVLRMQIGVSVEPGAQDTRMSGGTVHMNGWGVLVGKGARTTVMTDVVMLQNAIAVQIEDAPNTLLARADLRQNGQALLLTETQNATLRSNRIEDNRVGVHLLNTTGILIFDNLIANDHLPGDRNTLIENGQATRWNITRTVGVNYLGGPWLGGNFWHDYRGTDADTDGIGDVPHRLVPDVLAPHPLPEATSTELGPLDFHPLVRYQDTTRPMGVPLRAPLLL